MDHANSRQNFDEGNDKGKYDFNYSWKSFKYLVIPKLKKSPTNKKR